MHENERRQSAEETPFLRALVTFRPPLMSRRTTLLLVSPVWFGFIVFTALGRPLEGLLVALGAYIVLFGGGQPLRARLRAYAIAALGLLGAVALGMAAGGSALLTWLAYLGSAVLAVLVTRRLDPGPPGPYFFVLMVGGGTLLGGVGLGIPLTLVLLALGSALAMLMGGLDALLDRRTADADPAGEPDDVDATPEAAGAGPDRGSTLLTFLRIAIALSATLGISALRGDAHPFWGVLVVVLVLSYPGDSRQLTVRAVSRILGTLAGLLLFLPVADLHLGSAGYVAVLCVLLWCVARWTARNYLLGSVLITLLALFMSVPLTPDESPLQLTLARGIDTVIAGIVSLAVLRLVRPRPANDGIGRTP